MNLLLLNRIPNIGIPEYLNAVNGVKTKTFYDFKNVYLYSIGNATKWMHVFYVCVFSWLFFNLSRRFDRCGDYGKTRILKDIRWVIRVNGKTFWIFFFQKSYFQFVESIFSNKYHNYCRKHYPSNLFLKLNISLQPNTLFLPVY